MSDYNDKVIGPDKADNNEKIYHTPSKRFTQKNGLGQDKANSSKNKEEDTDEEFQIPGTNNLW